MMRPVNIVIIEEGQYLAVCRLDGGIARRRGTLNGREVDDLQVLHAWQGSEHGVDLRAAVVDDDGFPVLIGLPANGKQCIAKHLRAVLRRDDDGDSRALRQSSQAGVAGALRLPFLLEKRN